MSVIKGSLFSDIVNFHQPQQRANTAAIVIDEMILFGQRKQLKPTLQENNAERNATFL